MNTATGRKWTDTIRRGVVGFLAIFLGVSLSFVAEDWREGLGERREARRVLEGIMADLGQDLPAIQSLTETDSTAAAAGLWLHASWERRPLPAESVDWALSRLHRGGPYSPIRSEYESAKHSGRLQLITSPELRSRITELYEQDHTHHARVGDISHDFDFEFWRVLRPYVVYEAHFGGGWVTPAPHMPNWREAVQDPILRNALVHMVTFRRLRSRQLRSHFENSADLRDLIAAELEDDGW